MGRLEVIQESDTGMNEKFRDNFTGETLNRTEIKNRIENGMYQDYNYYRAKGKLIIRSNKGVENLE